MEQLLKRIQVYFPEAKKCKNISNVIEFDEFMVTITSFGFELSIEQEQECSTCFCETYAELTICYSKEQDKIIAVIKALSELKGE